MKEKTAKAHVTLTSYAVVTCFKEGKMGIKDDPSAATRPDSDRSPPHRELTSHNSNNQSQAKAKTKPPTTETMNSKQIVVLFLVVALVGEQATAHTPLSIIKWIGHMATKPIVALTHLPLIPLKAHFAAKALVAKKLAIVKAGLIAKPLIVKAAVIGAVAHKGKHFVARTQAPALRTTPLPLLRRILPQRINLPEVIVPVRLSLDSGKMSQQRISQVRDAIPSKV